MKLKSTLVAAFSVAAITTSQAFNIDFNAITVTDVPIAENESFTVEVDNYGTVTFTNITPDPSSSIAIGNNFLDNEGNNVNSLELEGISIDDGPPIEAEVIMVTFNGAEVTNAQAVFAGNSANPFDVGIFVDLDALIQQVGYSEETPFEGAYYAATIGAPGSDGVGLQSISWDVVPEPSSAALGALGMSMILLRRRRA
jgi:hypothetical protein